MQINIVITKHKHEIDMCVLIIIIFMLQINDFIEIYKKKITRITFFITGWLYRISSGHCVIWYTGLRHFDNFVRLE